MIASLKSAWLEVNLFTSPSLLFCTCSGDEIILLKDVISGSLTQEENCVDS